MAFEAATGNVPPTEAEAADDDDDVMLDMPIDTQGGHASAADVGARAADRNVAMSFLASLVPAAIAADPVDDDAKVELDVVSASFTAACDEAAAAAAQAIANTQPVPILPTGAAFAPLPCYQRNCSDIRFVPLPITDCMPALGQVYTHPTYAAQRCTTPTLAELAMSPFADDITGDEAVAGLTDQISTLQLIARRLDDLSSLPPQPSPLPPTPPRAASAPPASSPLRAPSSGSPSPIFVRHDEASSAANRHASVLDFVQLYEDNGLQERVITLMGCEVIDDADELKMNCKDAVIPLAVAVDAGAVDAADVLVADAEPAPDDEVVDDVAVVVAAAAEDAAVAADDGAGVGAEVGVAVGVVGVVAVAVGDVEVVDVADVGAAAEGELVDNSNLFADIAAVIDEAEDEDAEAAFAVGADGADAALAVGVVDADADADAALAVGVVDADADDAETDVALEVAAFSEDEADDDAADAGHAAADNGDGGGAALDAVAEDGVDDDESVNS